MFWIQTNTVNKLSSRELAHRLALLQILQQHLPAMKQRESERTLLTTWAAQAHIMEKAKD